MEAMAVRQERKARMGDNVIIREFSLADIGFALHDQPFLRILVPFGTQIRMRTPVIVNGGKGYFLDRPEVIAEYIVGTLAFKSETEALRLRDIRLDQSGEIVALP